MLKNRDASGYAVHLRISYIPFDYYVTGSRFFGNARADSDFDYFTQNTFDTRMWLKRNGFRKLPEGASYYNCDINLAQVYRKGNVDIQLVKDVSKKLKAQEILKANGVLNNLDKSARRAAWNDTYRFMARKDKTIAEIKTVLESKPAHTITLPVANKEVSATVAKPSAKQVCEVCGTDKRVGWSHFGVNGKAGNVCLACLKPKAVASVPLAERNHFWRNLALISGGIGAAVATALYFLL